MTDTPTKEITDLTDDELDAAVAEEVMGWKPERVVRYSGRPPRYSTDIATAWDVLARMRTLEDGNGVVGVRSTDDPERWRAWVEFDGNRHVGGYADTPSRAICEAALAAIRTKNHAQ